MGMRPSAFFVSAAALAIAATPAMAAVPEKPAPEKAKPATTRSPPDFAAMMTVMDKLFPPQPDPDPARFALARTSVQVLWPDGAYGKMMTGFMGGMMDRVMQLKASDLAELSKDKKPPVATKDKDLSLHDQAAAKDPYFNERMAAMRQVVTEEVGKISTIIDPRMRDGLARAMARRFDPQQLNDINRFFATPSGRAFAGQYMQLWVDPDTIRSIFASMPEMMKLMPDIMEKFKAANDKFPSPKKAPAAPAKP
jgi:hypothetical protein